MGTGAAVQVKDLGCYSRGLGRTLDQGVTWSEPRWEGGGEGRVGWKGCLCGRCTVLNAGHQARPPQSPVPRSPLFLVPELTPLTLSRPSLRLLRGQEQKAPRSERPAGMRLATSQEAMPGSSWGYSWKHTLYCAWHT